MKFQKIITDSIALVLFTATALLALSPVLASAAEPDILNQGSFSSQLNGGGTNAGGLSGGGSNIGGISGGGSNIGGLSGGGINTGNGGKFDNPLGPGNSSLAGLLNKVLQVVIMLGAIVVVFFYIYAGFKFVWARGDTAAIKQATLTLTWTTVGAMVVLGAQVISAAIQGTVQQLNIGK